MSSLTGPALQLAGGLNEKEKRLNWTLLIWSSTYSLSNSRSSLLMRLSAIVFDTDEYPTDDWTYWKKLFHCKFVRKESRNNRLFCLVFLIKRTSFPVCISRLFKEVKKRTMSTKARRLDANSSCRCSNGRRMNAREEGNKTTLLREGYWQTTRRKKNALGKWRKRTKEKYLHWSIVGGPRIESDDRIRFRPTEFNSRIFHLSLRIVRFKFKDKNIFELYSIVFISLHFFFFRVE